MKKILLIIIPILLFAFSCANSIEDEVHFINGETMGTTFSIKFTSKTPIDILQIETEINNILQIVNQQMSTFIPSSELSLFNSSLDTNWINVSSDLAFVVNEAQNISKLSNGKFDITIAPLVNLWGFGPNDKPQTIPTQDVIDEFKQYVGYKNIEVSFSPPSIKKHHPKVTCDLSAIAKGFGVDKVSEYLLSKGVDNHLVEIGGELRASGKKFNNDWLVGISAPNQSVTIQEKIKLNNLSMATSGDYWNYFEENGIRYSHTIDPLTGKPITHNLASVTVVAHTCAESDAFATAIDVMGPEEGLQFANNNELKVYLIVKGKDNFEVLYTPQFENLISKGN
ncbi:MAG: FAD:protein FMN transferase [Bacteroidetes bacterium]|nr:FAD:protein FMN transferase [Bacteroidota bacterium]MBU1113541.1 FAD:protein FMN transferase [Bacteroidota bacterium]MBU1800335.1 FAD:protein FMN transferase [Bacteroidota bacterium]